MSDTYVECLVTGKASAAAKALKVILIILLVLFVLSMVITGMVGLFLAAITGVGLYFTNQYTHVEYEYLYLDREISVDRVLGKSRRKRVATYTMERMEILAPVRSYHLDGYRNRKVKTTDYSSLEDVRADGGYAMYYEGGERVLLSPSSEMLKAVKNAAPRKVFTD
ncbi:MAG: DUF6106 family protein [Lachnospiraceae bacterium]|nr:DUF6106 family protein [Lachnospiraceae bacterium]